MIVEKRWGREDILVNSPGGNYCLKRMELDPGVRCSVHNHRRKDETFIVESGQLYLATWPLDGADASGSYSVVRAGESVRIQPGTWHSFWSPVKTVFMEVSTFDTPEDSIRLDESCKVEKEWAIRWKEWGGNHKILVIGDVMLDTYVHTSPKGITPEAPVLVTKMGSESEQFLGGAGNVAYLLATRGVDVTLTGAIGDDMEGDQVSELLLTHGIRWAGSVGYTRTTHKTRLQDRMHMLMRLDLDMPNVYNSCVNERLHQVMEGLESQEFSAVILSDYAKGVFAQPAVLASLDRMAGRWMTFVDPSAHAISKRSGPLSLLTPHFLVKPNRNHVTEAAGLHSSANDEAVAWASSQSWAAHCVMTAGADPGTVISHGSKPRPIVSGSKAGWVVDPVGAGDEFLATLVLEYLSEAAHGRVSHEAVHVAAERAAAWATERAMLNWRRRR